MAVNRVTNLSVFSNTFRNVGNVQAELAELQKQISSGIKADDFRDLNGQVEQFTYLEARTKQVIRYQQSNTIGIARLKTADQAMNQVEQLADNMEDLLVQRRNPALADNIGFQQQMKNLMQSVAKELNISFEGRFLFSGTSTDEVPVPNALAEPVQVGVPDDSYYNGSKQNVTFRVDDRVEFDFPVRADAEAFQKLYAAANLALRGDINDEDEDLRNAINMIQEAQDGISALRGQVNNNIINVTQINDRHKTLELYWKGVTEEVSKTDIVAASIQVSNNEAILQASFQAYARLSQLRLTDFLR